MITTVLAQRIDDHVKNWGYRPTSLPVSRIEYEEAAAAVVQPYLPPMPEKPQPPVKAIIRTSEATPDGYKTSYKTEYDHQAPAYLTALRQWAIDCAKRDAEIDLLRQSHVLTFAGVPLKIEETQKCLRQL
jgi:hypothetical protein